MCGAHALDIPPQIPMPLQWAVDSKSPPASPWQLSTISLAWKKQFPIQQDFISIFDDITQLISLDRALTDDQFEAATASGAWTEPTIFRLLSIRPLRGGSEHANLIEEVCRLGTLLFLAPVWRVMGANPVYTFSFSRNLLWLLDNYVVHWQDLKPLLLWTLYFAAIETKNVLERGRFAHILAVLMAGMQISEWKGLMDVVKGVLWVDKIFGDGDRALQEEVLGLLALNISRGSLNEQHDNQLVLARNLHENIWRE